MGFYNGTDGAFSWILHAHGPYGPMAHNLNHMTWLHPTHDLQVMHLVKAVSHGFHPHQETHPTKVELPLPSPLN